jgi:hypothetical protein
MSTPPHGSSSAQGQAGPPPPPDQGITMLGAQATGKTTFLGALRIALLRRDELGWSLSGDNPGSAQALVKFVNDMTEDHLFPRPTQAMENYNWSLEGELPGVLKRERWWFRRRSQYIRIPLNLIDSPGESADGAREYGRQSSRRLIESLARSSGIVLFFDPVREFEHGDAFRNMYGVLTQLKTEMRQRGRLPHYVAVCITKFDDISVYEAARKLRIVEFDAALPELPQVPDEYALELFRRLVRLSKGDAADLVLPMLRQTFREDRIRFFVTSAIGFFIDPDYGVFDPEDYQNHIPREVRDAPDHIRGGIYPINVIEPVLWLGRNVLRAADSER